MTTNNPDSIDAFLKSIPGLNMGETAQELQQATQGTQPQTAPVSVRIMLAGLPNFEYAVHCFVMEKGITETDLEGWLLPGQWTFRIESLSKFSEKYEKVLELANINYHRNPPVPPGPSQNVVSYRLVKRLNDPQGHGLLETVTIATSALYTELSQGQS